MLAREGVGGLVGGVMSAIEEKREKQGEEGMGKREGWGDDDNDSFGGCVEEGSLRFILDGYKDFII